MPQEVRLGVIGCGVMARYHMNYFPRLSGLRFSAAADIDPRALAHTVQTQNVRGFEDGLALLDSGLIDAVLIATPHYFHPLFTQAAMSRGIHVLTEKPVAVSALAAQQVNQTHTRHPRVLYAVMFNQRTYSTWAKVRQLVQAGAVGELQRVSWIVTTWFRPDAYYRSGTWRATWAGEGGGVLLNQCPHNLDLLQWIVGMPVKVTAQVGLGRYHDIEVEDQVNAIFEFANGATGMFVTSTGEAPGTSRLEIAGDRGRIVTDGGPVIELYETAASVRDFCRTSPDPFSAPPGAATLIQTDGKKPDHPLVMQNFIDAILHGTPLLAAGEEGLASLELANAMLMSGLLHQTVPVPTDREAYDRMLKNLARQSRYDPQTAGPARIDEAWQTH
jgi:predicted dehydrogenase